MALYIISGLAGAASVTAASAGIIKVDQSATLCSPKIYTIEIGPQTNSIDSIFAARTKRQTTAGTWTAQTPALLDSTHQAVALANGAIASTVAGTGSTVLSNFGWHQRAGYRWVAIPGGELAVAVAATNGIIVEYVFAQSNDIQFGTLWYNE
jgi:hypothetical protein